MAGLGNVAPSVSKLGNGGHGILDLIFRDCALILSDTSILYKDKLNNLAGKNGFLGGVGKALSSVANYLPAVPLPIVGFSFQTPTNLNILQYDYSEYPMFGRISIVNSMVKGMGEIRITGLRPITRGNSIAINYLLNQFTLVKLVESYADAGGLWTLHTMWGTYDNLVLVSLDGTTAEGTTLGGTAFTFTFKRVNFDATKKQKGFVSNLLGKLL